MRYIVEHPQTSPASHEYTVSWLMLINKILSGLWSQMLKQGLHMKRVLKTGCERTRAENLYERQGHLRARELDSDGRKQLSVSGSSIC